MTARLIENFAHFAVAPNGVARLRELILELAVKAQLFSQDSNWKATQLRELVVSSGAGWSPSCESRPRSGDQWGVLKVSAVTWSQFQPDENKALPPSLVPRPALEVQPGDFLVSRANTADLVARSVVVESTPPKLMLSDKIVRLKLSDDCDPRFVQLVNTAPASRRYYALVAGGTSSSMKNVSREQILALPILLPPLAEQHRIVAKVDELMALCDRLEARQQDAEAAHNALVQVLLDSLTQARDVEEFRASWERVAEQFEVLFTTEKSVEVLKRTVMQLGVEGRLHSGAPRSAWRTATIDTFCTVQGGIQKTPLRAPVRDHFPYLRVANVQRGVIDVTVLERYELAPDELDRWRLRAGDLLIVEGNGSEKEIGRCAIWRGEVQDCVYQNHLMRVRPTGGDSVEFLELYLNSPVGTAHMRRLAITTSGLYNLSVGKIRSIPIDLPPKEDQALIVAAVDEILRHCERLERRIVDCREQHAQLADALVESAILT